MPLVYNLSIYHTIKVAAAVNFYVASIRRFQTENEKAHAM